MEVRGQMHASAALFPEKKPRTHWIGGWVGHRIGLDGLEEVKTSYLLLEFEPRTVRAVAWSL